MSRKHKFHDEDDYDDDYKKRDGKRIKASRQEVRDARLAKSGVKDKFFEPEPDE
jgi:hypothetical protein